MRNTNPRTQGRPNIATCLRSGGIFKYVLVSNLLPSPSVKKFENGLIFGEGTGKSLVSCFFLTHNVVK